ncbi:FISUMP domain-containing protein [Marinifilum sp. RC60d5]|uniref:FISUMP domain-containing protein n=1 Tax=Marinifilum sp. RC60d5 TaxID=3458414 RepID=UPI00403580B2
MKIRYLIRTAMLFAMVVGFFSCHEESDPSDEQKEFTINEEVFIPLEVELKKFDTSIELSCMSVNQTIFITTNDTLSGIYALSDYITDPQGVLLKSNPDLKAVLVYTNEIQSYTSSSGSFEMDILENGDFIGTFNAIVVDDYGKEIEISNGSFSIEVALVEDCTSTSNIQSGTVTDIDGNIYRTVKIGTQWWMAENLKVTHYANGTSIPYVTDKTVWDNLIDNNSAKAYCYYNNNVNTAYGALYTFAAAVNGSPHNGTDHVQGVAPEGWHIPSDEEWKVLEMHLGMSAIDANKDGVDRGADEGDKLKTIYGWDENGNGSDDFGFSALPGGGRFDYGSFYFPNRYCHFWTSTESSSGSGAEYRYIYYKRSTVTRYTGPKSNGFSVRCVKDD